MWFPLLTSLLRSESRRPADFGNRKRPGIRPAVEALEERSVPAATLNISDTFVMEGDVAAFTVTLSEASADPVTVAFATRDVKGAYSPESGDYASQKGTLTFAPGETSKTIFIQTNYDDDFALDQFAVKLSQAHGAHIGNAEGICNIYDYGPYWL